MGTPRPDDGGGVPDSQRLLSGSKDKTVRVWRYGTLENTFRLHTGWCVLVALPDNKHALPARATPSSSSTSTTAPSCTFKHHTEVTCLALLPDGLRFVSGSDDRTARIVETASIANLRHLKNMHARPHSSCALSGSARPIPNAAVAAAAPAGSGSQHDSVSAANAS